MAAEMMLSWGVPVITPAVFPARASNEELSAAEAACDAEVVGVGDSAA